MKTRLALNTAFCVIIPLVIYFCVSFLHWSQPIISFCCITSFAITLWITGIFPGVMTAILLPVFYILFKVGNPPSIFSSWLSPICWLVLGGVIIGKMMEETGISRRIALWSLKICGSSIRRLFFGILVAGLLLAPFVPTVMGKAALFLAILSGLCKTLHFEPKSKESSALFLCGLLAIAEPKFLFYTASVDSSLMVALAKQSDVSISWGQYFLHNAIPGALYIILCLLLLYLFVPHSSKQQTTNMEEEYNKLGTLSLQEKKGFFILCIIALAMLTEKLHGIDIGWIMILSAGACFIPGINLLNSNHINKLSLSIVFFVMGCMSIGAAAQSSGINGVLFQYIQEIFSRCSNLTSFLTAYCTGSIGAMIFTTIPTIASFTPLFTDYGLSSGISPQPLLYALLYGIDQFLLPYAFAPALYFFASGYINIKYYLSFYLLKWLMTILFLSVIAYPIFSFFV